MKRVIARNLARWEFAFVSDEDASVWHRLTSLGMAFCGAGFRNREHLRIADDFCTPPDGELCPRCAELFEQERRRVMGEVYSLIIDLARRHRTK